MALITRKPAGAAGAAPPWNFPLVMAARKITPSLAAGCWALIKPAEPVQETDVREQYLQTRTIRIRTAHA